jgi:SpoVK/Ycf46/Vps4 family AAA+-type ATPase
MPVTLDKKEIDPLVKEIKEKYSAVIKKSADILSKMAGDEALSETDGSARRSNKQKDATWEKDYTKLSDKDKLLFYLATKTENYVGADIESVCREAAILALREDMGAKEIRKRHFEEALKKVRPSVNKEIKEAYEGLQDSFKSAHAKQIRDDRPAYMG